MTEPDIREAQLKLLRNNLILCRDEAETLGLELAASLIAMALRAMPSEGPVGREADRDR